MINITPSDESLKNQHEDMHVKLCLEFSSQNHHIVAYLQVQFMKGMKMEHMSGKVTSKGI